MSHRVLGSLTGRIVLALSLLLCATGSSQSLDAQLKKAGELRDEYAATGNRRTRYELARKIDPLLRALGRTRSHQAVEVLASFYEFPEFDDDVTMALARIGSKSAVEAIADALETPEPKTVSGPFTPRCRREAILESCRGLRATLPDDLLLKILAAEEHRDGVRAATRFLARRFDDDALDVLFKALEVRTPNSGFDLLSKVDRRHVAVRCIVEGLYLRGHGPGFSVRGAGEEEKDEEDKEDESEEEDDDEDEDEEEEREVSVLGKLSPSEAEAIYEELREKAADDDEPFFSRAVALHSLGRLKRTQALPVIRKILEEEKRSSDLIVAAADAAIALGDPKAGPWLVPVIERLAKSLSRKRFLEEELAVLVEAIYPLQIKEAEESLMRLLKSRHFFLRSTAIAALPVLGDEVAAPILKDILEDDRDWRGQLAAVEACRRMRSRAAVDLLVHRVGKQQGRLQFDILMALHDLTGVNIPYVARDWQNWWKVNRDNYTPPPADQVRKRRETFVLFPEEDKQTYFGMRVLSQRLCFIGDISGSMQAPMEYDGSSRPRIDVMKDEILRLVKTFKRKTYFNVYFFREVHQQLFKTLARITTGSFKKASRFVKSAQANGGTNLYDPLEEALHDPYVDTIYLLSDGHPTAGKHTETEAILNAVRRINRLRGIQINTISIGGESELLQRLARDNGGLYRNVE